MDPRELFKKIIDVENRGWIRYDGCDQIRSSDDKLQAILELSLPLEIIHDGEAAVKGYLSRGPDRQYLKKEIGMLEKTLEDIQEAYVRGKIFFNPYGGFSCENRDLAERLRKRVRKDILAVGYESVLKHLSGKVHYHKELFAYIVK